VTRFICITSDKKLHMHTQVAGYNKLYICCVLVTY